MNAREMWSCGSCGETYGFYSDAQDCCAPSPKRVFCCGECEEPFDNHDAAKACCAISDPDGDPLRPAATAAELEAAGQMRLELPEARP